MMMKKLMVSVLALGTLSIAPALYSQRPSQDKQKDQQQADRLAQETFTGCLTEEDGSYMLGTPDGDKVSVSGPANLAKHKNHTVKLTGRKSEEGGKTSLSVTKIEHVSDSCSK
jgi:hypothetical protein